MKAIHFILLAFAMHSSVYAQQFYVRGEVKDEAGNILQNVTILQHKTGYIFRSGSSGTFGIISNEQMDTLSFTMEGFRPEKLVVDAEKYVTVKLKPLPASSLNSKRDKLSSMTKDL